jgi:hypothetical protein
MVAGVDEIAVAAGRAGGWIVGGDDAVATTMMAARARSFGQGAWAVPVHAAFRFPQRGRVCVGNVHGWGIVTDHFFAHVCDDAT